MEIEFHPDAVIELREATLYYQSQASGLGERFLSTIEQSLTQISTFPEAFPTVLPYVRQCKVSNFPYAIIYRLQLTYILIIALAHSRRKPQYWSGRK